MVVQAVTLLPDSVGARDRERAQAHLLQLPGEFDAQALKALGRRVFEAIDPDAADLEEGRRLEAEERAANRATYLRRSAGSWGATRPRDCPGQGESTPR